MGLLFLFGWVVFTTFPLFQAFAQIVWASSGTVSNKHSKTETKTLRNVDYNTTNVIYLLECSIQKEPSNTD